MNFQLVVIIILGILLIITLLSFYYIATASGSNIQFPPSIPICPDYYYQVLFPNGTGDGQIMCKAMPNMEQTIVKAELGDECVFPVFPANYYSGSNANCLKYNWYKNCNSIPAWEGVTYGVSNPCATT